MKQLSKLLSVILSVTMVFSSAVFTNISVKADMTTEQMVADARYNLALKKNVQVAPSMQEGNAACLTDGKFTPGGEHAATTFGKTGTYYQVDLGDAYDLSTLDQLVVGYKENSEGDAPMKGYKIQISTNGLDFTDAKSVPGTHVKDACENNNLVEVTSLSDATGKAVRYLRLYYPDSYTWGIQATEIAVLDIDGNAAKVEIEKCDDAAGVTVTSPDYNTIKYNIQAGENQEDYKYIVYLENGINDRIIGYGVDAGKDYVVENLFSGMWTVRVVACYNGAASEGIRSERINIDELANQILMKRNIANAYAGGYPSKIVEMSSIYEGHSLDTAAKAIDGIPLLGEGSNACMRTGAGSPQYFVIDLGEYYTPSEMKEVILAYTNNDTYASDTKVEFSLDGKQYTEAGEKKGYEFAAKSEKFCAYNRVPLNKLENYTEKGVRFVKITLSGGGSNYGYVVNEVCVIANTDEPTVVGTNIPEAADVIVDTTNLERIKYTIVAGEDQKDATYVVSFGSKTINAEAKAGVEYEYNGIEAGTYEIKVSHLEDGWLSKGIAKTIVVDGYINYIANSLNLVYRNAHPEVTVTCDSDNRDYNGNPNTGLVNGSQGIGADIRMIQDGIYTNLAHHTGYLQTRPDREDANIIYDLDRDYNPADIHSVIAMYAAAGNAATEYEILFSATGDENSYERVFYAKNVSYQKFISDRVDVSNYTQDAVRYIKYHIITGNYQKHIEGECKGGCNGYNLCELAVMGEVSLLPDAPTNVTVESPEYDTVVVKWDDIADENAVYKIYMDGRVLFQENAGVNEKSFIAMAGTHKIKVSAVVNGMESKSVEYSVTVQTETTTPKPTTTPVAVTNQGENNNPTTSTATNPATDKAQPDAKRPGTSKITKAKVGKKKVIVKFKRVKSAKGYRIQYSLKKNFKKAKTITTKKLKATIKKLKKGKKYYIRVQAYKVVNGKKVYGLYSKRVKTKKIK